MIDNTVVTGCELRKDVSFDHNSHVLITVSSHIITFEANSTEQHALIFRLKCILLACRAAESMPAGYMFCFCFLFLFNDFCQTSCFKIY